MHSTEQIPELVQRLYEVVADLERLFPGRRFTPDGHLVGSIGEVLAAHKYGLELLPASSEGHDAVASTGLRVQVKATQGDAVAMRSEPDHLVVLRILPNGSAVEVFNGPGKAAWEAAGKRQKNGQRPISLSKLRALMKEVPRDATLKSIGA